MCQFDPRYIPWPIVCTTWVCSQSGENVTFSERKSRCTFYKQYDRSTNTAFGLDTWLRFAVVLCIPKNTDTFTTLSGINRDSDFWGLNDRRILELILWRNRPNTIRLAASSCWVWVPKTLSKLRSSLNSEFQNRRVSGSFCLFVCFVWNAEFESQVEEINLYNYFVKSCTIK